MNKIRVYELAQQLGVDNKEIIARLQAVGVTVKNHMAVIDEADAKKLQAPVTTVKDVAKEEVRVSTGLIRRRAKVVETVAEEPPVEVKPEPVVVAEPGAAFVLAAGSLDATRLPLASIHKQLFGIDG